MKTSMHRVLLAGLLVAGTVGLLAQNSASNIEDLFDHGLYESLSVRTVENVQDLIATYPADREPFLRILPPGDWEHVQTVEPIPIRLENLPPDFVGSLIPHQVAPAITGYRVYLAEETTRAGSRRWVVLNADSELLVSIRTPVDYDPFEELSVQHADLSNAAQLGDPEAVADWNELKQNYDPARLVLSVELVPEVDLIKYVWATSLAQSASTLPLGGSGISPMTSSTSRTALVFRAISRTNDTLYLTADHPSNYVNQVHLLGGTDLVNPDWRFLEFYDANGVTNETELVVDLDLVGPRPTRFFLGFDDDDDGMADWWELQSWPSISVESGSGESDGDKLQNLFEYYAGTDPSEGFVDTDEDGMSDDWEDYYKLDATDPSDADLDPDSDGFTNLEEFLNNGGALGTDPTDPNSHPVGAVYVDGVNGSDVIGDGSIANAYASISNGVIQAQTVERVVILPGIYTGLTNCNVQITNELMVVGTAGAIIDGEHVNHAYHIHGPAASNTVLRGLTIVNGYRESSAFGTFGGGGVACSDTSAVTIESCVFSNCMSHWEGGGLAFFQTSNILIQGCEFLSCTSEFSGGAVYLDGSEDVVLAECLMDSNVAEISFGGGLYAIDVTNVTVRGCTVRGNQAAEYGGGLDFDDSRDIEVAHCTIAMNEAGTDSGGGIFFWRMDTDSLVRNCLIYENSAEEDGGGVGDEQRGSGETVVESCTITSNTAVGNGGGIGIDGTLRCTNSIVYFNTSSDGKDIAAGTVVMDYCCAPSNVVVVIDNNITNEPGFVSQVTHDYRLQTNSPCLNEGLNIPAWMNEGDDLDGNPRIAGGTVDMGAYEVPQ